MLYPARMGKFRQYLLLIWKNFVLQKRRPVSTAFEIILPTLFILLLAIIKLNPSLKEQNKCVPGGEDRNQCNWSPFRPTEGVSDDLVDEFHYRTATNCYQFRSIQIHLFKHRVRTQIVLPQWHAISVGV